MWTLFRDVHSGGGQKEQWQFIYIEAPVDEAKVVFYNRFGHNPERVSCTCCGEDYSIWDNESLAQLSGYHRGCRYVDDPEFKAHHYLEAGEEPPAGYTVGSCYWSREYQTLEQYVKNKDVKVIYAIDIKPEERIGEIPQEGYVWV